MVSSLKLNHIIKRATLLPHALLPVPDETLLTYPMQSPRIGFHFQRFRLCFFLVYDPVIFNILSTQGEKGEMGEPGDPGINGLDGIDVSLLWLFINEIIRVGCLLFILSLCAFSGPNIWNSISIDLRSQSCSKVITNFNKKLIADI